MPIIKKPARPSATPPTKRSRAGKKNNDKATAKNSAPVPAQKATTKPSSPRATSPYSKDILLSTAKVDLLDIAGVSRVTGVKEETISVYRGRKAMPQPDITFGRSPVWHRETILEWDKGRRRLKKEGE